MKKSGTQPSIVAAVESAGDNKYRDCGIAWLGNIPSHWRLARMRHVSQAISGGTPSKENPDYWNGDVPWVSPKDMKRRVIDSAEDTITETAVAETGLKMIEPGSILIVVRGMILAHSFPVAITSVPVTINQDMKAIRFYEEVDPQFAAWYLTGVGKYILASIVEEAGYGTRVIRMDEWKSASIPVPPIDEQRAIVQFLDIETAAIDRVIEKHAAMLDLLAEQRRSQVIDAVCRGCAPSVRMKQSGIAWIGEIPSHWQVLPLKRVFDNLDSRRIPLSGEERAGMRKEYPYYGASGVIDHVEDFIFDESLILIAEDGANLLSRSSTLAFIANGKYWVNNHAHILRHRSGSIEFWAELLASIPLDPWVTGSAQPKLTAERLGSIQLPVPPSEETFLIAKEIERVASRILKAERSIETSIVHAREYRTSLISSAVTGKLDLRTRTP